MISYWNKGCKYLLKKDKNFKRYYNSDHSLRINKNKFDVLFKSILSQQISANAAMSIYKRSRLIIGPINYRNFKKNSHKIDILPISKNKKKSIKSLIINYHLVSKIKSNEFTEKNRKELISIFGIGNWTVDMFSIFHLGLPNILPLGDLGLINAYKKFYKDPNLKRLLKNSLIWKNYSTIVTWYLWSSYDSEPLYL